MSRASQLKTIEAKLAELDRQWATSADRPDKLVTLEPAIEETYLKWVELKQASGDVPDITIIMSVYNTERYIKAAIESILNQTFTNFELLVIDDGSADDSIKITHSFKDPRIRIVHQTNHGLVYSFNKGLKLARAELIARMDSDDICLPSRLDKEFAWITAEPRRGLVGTFFAYIDGDTTQPLDVTMTSPTKHIDIVRMMYFLNPYAHGSILMRRAAALEVGGYHAEYEPSEDYDLWRRITQQWQVGQIPEILYLWRFHPASISRRKSTISESSAARTVQNMFAGPTATKSTRAIVKDQQFYAQFHAPLNEVVGNQYVDHQVLLAFKFLVHGKLRAGYQTALALLWLRPREFRKLWKTLLWAPLKYLRDKVK